MYASVIQCDMHAINSSHERGRLGRILATNLGELSGFVAFVAIDIDSDTGSVAALCIFEDHAGLAAADDAIDQWLHEHYATGVGIQQIATGALIVQKGL